MLEQSNRVYYDLKRRLREIYTVILVTYFYNLFFNIIGNKLRSVEFPRTRKQAGLSTFIIVCQR